MAVRMVETTAGWAMGELDGCLAVVWRAQPTQEAFRKRNQIIEELAKSHPKRCALVEIVEETSKPPDDQTRRVAMEVFKHVGADLAAIAMVLEGNQMRAAVNRAILTSMTFFVKQLQPTKIFKHASDAARWARPLMRQTDAFEKDLLEALEDVRGAIGK